MQGRLGGLSCIGSNKHNNPTYRANLVNGCMMDVSGLLRPPEQGDHE